MQQENPWKAWVGAIKANGTLVTVKTKENATKKNLDKKFAIHLFFFYKQSIFDPLPENCLSFSKKSPQKLFSNCLVDGLLTSIA